MKEKIALLSILANLILSVTKILIGSLFHSAAILAEGFHSLTDIFSSAIGYFGIRASQKPVDKEHPYGHYKFEVLSGIVITLILLTTGAGVIYDAYRNYSHQRQINLGFWAYAIMFFSTIVNYATAKIKIYYGKKENSITLLSDGSHDKADALVSLAVFIGLFLTQYWIYADTLLATLIGLYIIKESFSLGKEAMDSLLDVSAGQEKEDQIRAIAQEEKVEISSLKTQKKGSTITANLEIKLSANLSVDEATKISENLRKKITEKITNISYIAIQIKSHAVETDFYRPAFGREFHWQRQRARFQKEIKRAEGKGPNGQCVCPRCSYAVTHKRGTPCSSLRCPHCNIPLNRK